MELTLPDGRTLRNVTFTPLPDGFKPEQAPPPVPMPRLLNPSDMKWTMTFEGESAQKVYELFDIPKPPPPPANRQQRRARERERIRPWYAAQTRLLRRERRHMWLAIAAGRPPF
jgi:hypothetical protein